MLTQLSPADAQQLRSFFRDEGYIEQNLRQGLGAAELPSSRLRNFARLMDRTRDTTALNTLLRWFWIGTPQDAVEAAKTIPSWVIEVAFSAGMLRRDGDLLIAEVMLLPVDGLLIAADHTAKIEATDPGLVLWPNPTSGLLSRFTVRRQSRSTLDLGTGSGVLALMASPHSERVVGTDLNPRAVEFAAFNARLNGVENVEFLTGDTFEPVAGQEFDLIFSNPPFFISPSDHYLFCDNSMDLDQLCRRLVREAPKYLSEGGYFQMLCEWAQVKGQPWEERIAEWFDKNGCDAWVMKGNTQDPAEYAQERIRGTPSSIGNDDALYDGYMKYYRDRGVEAIHDGIVAMRRRSGANWVLIEEVGNTPREPFGDLVLQTFAARDFLQSHTTDGEMLAAKPRLSKLARLEQVFEQSDSRWQPGALTLRLVKGFPASLGLRPLVAEFLGGCNGDRSLGELVPEFAAKVNAPIETVQTECLDMIRKLIERGFVAC